MDLQIEFNKTIELLKKNRLESSEINSLVNLCLNSTVTFQSLMDKNSPNTLKENILGMYEFEAKLVKNKESEPITCGYDSLIERLKSTKHKYIAISDFITSDCSFKVFTDFNKKEILGVLVSKTTLQEVRNKIETIKRMIKIQGVEIDDSKIKNLFINGQYQHPKE
jgi:hypothetical protein